MHYRLSGQWGFEKYKKVDKSLQTLVSYSINPPSDIFVMSDRKVWISCNHMIVNC